MGMLAFSVFIVLQAYNAKKAVELEKNGLRNENDSLSGKIEELAKERTRLQGKVNALSGDLDKANNEKQDIQSQYDLLVKDRDDLVDKLKSLQKDNDQLQSDLKALAREKQRLGQALEDNLTPLKNKNAQLKEQLNNSNGLKTKLETELGQLKGDKSDLERKLNEINSFLEQKLTDPKYLSLKEQLDSIRGSSLAQMQAGRQTEAAQPEKESVELPPIVVKPQTQGQERTPTIQTKKGAPVKSPGRVLEINRENKFVIIDKGLDAGTKIGDTLKVYKQGFPIATIKVIKVRQNISACDIKEEINSIEVGDIVH